MFFTKAGRVIALGYVLQAAFCTTVTCRWSPLGKAASCPAIRCGTLCPPRARRTCSCLAFGVVMGILAEISMSIATFAQAAGTKGPTRRADSRSARRQISAIAICTQYRPSHEDHRIPTRLSGCCTRIDHLAARRGHQYEHPHARRLLDGAAFGLGVRINRP